MNKEDIKKGLETCCSICTCDNCPYEIEDIRNCSDTLKLDARACIIKQEQEIERLTEERNKLSETLSKYIKASDKEIAAHVKDTLNRLKQYSRCDNFFPDGKWHRYVFVDDIDKLLEEYEK